MNMESSNISQSRRKGPFSGEKGPLIWQLRFTPVLLQVAFYVKARLCRSQCSEASTCSFLLRFLHRSKTGMFVTYHNFSRRFLEVVKLVLLETLQ